MVVKLRLVFSITILFLTFSAVAQQNLWQATPFKNKERVQALKNWQTSKASTFVLNEEAFRSGLPVVGSAGPVEKNIRFPNGEGGFFTFKVRESSILAPELAAKYPQIRSYRGVSVNEPGKSVHFSVSHKGVQAMVLGGTPEDGTLYLQKSKKGHYVLYNRKDRTANAERLVCKTEQMLAARGSSTTPTAKLIDDGTLRTYRVAISASGTYTRYHGGSKADALAAINATMTRINAIFERDLSVTFELIANTDEVIYLDPLTDPYTNSLSTEVQATLTDVIGEENYDIGHLFNQEDNALDGNAGFIGSVCTDNRKGSAYATLGTPEGDVFDIDLVAHEMGHQFGANHTFSHNGESTNVQVEPGSGTTIMGYAGITGVNNVATNSDDYFHYSSVLQIRDFLQTISCGQAVPTANTPPTVVDVPDHIIPKGTAFVLEAQATDPDSLDVLTYTWEQIDNGIVTRATFGPTNPTGAMFRSLPPTLAPFRYFPRLERVLNGELVQIGPNIGDAWETVPTIERDLNFAVTVRDNSLNGGQTVADEVRVSVTNSAGPFLVRSQDSLVNYVAGSVQTISWDVANTNVAPVLAQEVDIFLSLDGGLTFPIALAQNVPNDGSHDIVVPGVETGTARIMVRPSNAIFYAVNAANFSIQASEVVLNFPMLDYEVCSPDSLSIDFDYETYLGFMEQSVLSVPSPPPGLGVLFSQDTVSVDTTVTLSLSNIEALPVGSYPINVRASSPSSVKELTLQLRVLDTVFGPVELLAPVNGAVDISKDLLLEWEDGPNVTFYDVEVATDSLFVNVVETATVPITSYPPNNLENDAFYFWRVRPSNSCGTGIFGPPNSFTTIPFNCAVKAADDLPENISATGTPTITSKMAFFEDLPVADINVNLDLDHTFLADLTISLTSPAGTTVVLVSSSCGDARNINAVFDDDAQAFSCFANPAISGTVRPLGSLSSFNGESLLGEWILEVVDNAPSDGGTLNGFSLEVCVEGQFRPDADNDGVFDDGDDLCLNTPLGQEVDASGCAVYRFPKENFTVTLESESCRNANDGQLQITPKLILDYGITVSGPGVDAEQAFTDGYTLSDLGDGSYTVCITAMDGDLVYEEQCLEVVISQPEALNVAAKVATDGQTVVLDLRGADLYNVELNGITTQTSEQQLRLALKNGVNFLKVTTNRACQGTFEEQLLVMGAPMAFPNPFNEATTLYVATSDAQLNLAIFSSDGKLLRQGDHRLQNGSVPLDFGRWPSGLYYIRFTGRSVSGTVKVIKR
ncbi:reprolysin-like metallopeptidase [Maribacter sp. 2307ULW6-5]|uniref:reprolysin-like metallopeptidase n=1 Tax=Maribacter sp. 2307ULW6-5 TaxID=3386275 RepID=UPI0039BCA61B